MPFETLPLSAYALCYGPLALTIIGFIAFAWMTDSDARRKYLRDPDLRTDEERVASGDILGDRSRQNMQTAKSAKTPSGGHVTIQVDENNDAKASITTDSEAPTE